ncbi:hypothetical protein [Burkholderia cepacia]|uniref:hypothetical protein n=1 Tax=Burkholderia cepacia TaxID=292 RepID=UPI002654D5F6|nr:hypothetical protein [Burkholderia cepacia]MDN7611240.1 hypothetical protein [Burkholderia cepacia]
MDSNASAQTGVNKQATEALDALSAHLTVMGEGIKHARALARTAALQRMTEARNVRSHRRLIDTQNAVDVSAVGQASQEIH